MCVCSGLNEKIRPHRLRYLTALSPVVALFGEAVEVWPC